MSKKRKHQELDIFIKDNIIFAKNILTPQEQIDLYKQIVEIGDYPNGWREEMFFLDIDDKLDTDQKEIYKIIYSSYEKIMNNLPDTKNQRLINNIKHMYDNKVKMLAIEYNVFEKEQDSMAPHLDQWSSWNMVLSLGGDAFLKYGNKKTHIQGGDIYIFNGNQKKHAVDLIRETSNELWKEEIGNKPYRVCIQLRKNIK